jgi:hypothetical protein
MIFLTPLEWIRRCSSKDGSSMISTYALRLCVSLASNACKSDEFAGAQA